MSKVQEQSAVEEENKRELDTEWGKSGAIEIVFFEFEWILLGLFFYDGNSAAAPPPHRRLSVAMCVCERSGDIMLLTERVCYLWESISWLRDNDSTHNHSSDDVLGF